MKLNELLSNYRKEIGVTQKHISKVTGIDRNRLSNIETGRVTLSAEEFILICKKGFGVDPSFFADKVLETKTRGKVNGK